MKTILTLTLFLACWTTTAQWNIKYNTGNFYARAVVAINADTALLTGEAYGTFYRTNDGGASWLTHQTIFNTSWFVDMDFVSASIGYASGGTYFGIHNEILAKTTDGGITWDSLTSNSGKFGYMIGHIDFVSADTGYLAGEVVLQKTMDGGLTFDSITEPFDQITDIAFLNDQIGLVACSEFIGSSESRYYMKRTNDKGATWTIVHLDTMQNPNGLNNRQINKIAFVGANTVYAVGGNSTIMKSVDAGLTWSISSIAPFSTNLTALSFTDVNTGYINNAGGVYKTIDGGMNWIVQGVSPVGVIDHIDFADADVGYAGGQQGIYKTENGGAPLDIIQFDAQKLKLYPNPVRDILNINSDAEDLDIYDLKGRLIQALSRSEVKRIDVSGFNPGVYVVKSRSESGLVQKFVKL